MTPYPDVPYVEDSADLLARLRASNVKRIYLIHAPIHESGARRYARFLRAYGFTVIVAADARPHKEAIHDKDDEFVVQKVIDT